jgi:hypothetical protein
LISFAQVVLALLHYLYVIVATDLVSFCLSLVMGDYAEVVSFHRIHFIYRLRQRGGGGGGEQPLMTTLPSCSSISFYMVVINVMFL